MSNERYILGVRFPIQDEDFAIGAANGDLRAKLEAGWIPWTLALVAYRVYCKHGHGSQTLERLAERGGFGWFELVALLQGDFSAGCVDRAKALVQDAVVEDKWRKRAGGSA